MGSEERQLLVPNGTDLRLAVSVLTKHLRRGQELEALYWAQQIEQRYWRYLFRRLAIFACEDVGLGNPHAITVIQSCAEAYEAAKKHSRAPRPDGNLVAFPVLLLCRSPKNREADHLKNVVAGLVDDGWEPEIPAAAYDAHTDEGREAMSRDERVAHWLMVASEVEPEVGPDDWRLAMWRRAADAGQLRADRVEEHAHRWDEEGRLLYGIDGYQEEE